MRPVIERELSDGNLLLLNDHENDADDIVPELSYEPVEQVEKLVAKPKRLDFAG